MCFVSRYTGGCRKKIKINAGKMKTNEKMKPNRGYRTSDRKLEASNTSNMVCRYVMEVVH